MTQKKRAGPVVIERDLIRSKAFLTLTGKAPQVLLVFLSKRRLERRGLKGKERWVITNNGEIEFTYKEAESLGIPNATFVRAIDDLLEHGFIDIARSGIGLGRARSHYALSERWREYGEPDFKLAKRRARLSRTFSTPGKPKTKSEAIGTPIVGSENGA